ncbi:MAG: helix-turn-helix transcriptional regulator, partial [Paenibacillaceae bacterium]|nr:helix-turn-helix transcriptional regulator [Paenibacillaceae bacterium]
MEHIHIKLGRNLKSIRQTRGYSLDKVAELTGVSKGMLGQIERGETSPTIS